MVEVVLGWVGIAVLILIGGAGGVLTLLHIWLDNARKEMERERCD